MYIITRNRKIIINMSGTSIQKHDNTPEKTHTYWYGSLY